VAGLGDDMKRLLIAFAVSISVAAPSFAQTIYQVDVRKILASNWTHVGKIDATDYFYQHSHIVQYASGPIIPTNVDKDIFIKTNTFGPNGTVSETGLIYGTMVCDKSGKLPNKFLVMASHSFSVDENGMPGAPVDNTFTIDANSDSWTPIEQGSVLAQIAKVVCAGVH
jgi:hypothetical protein